MGKVIASKIKGMSWYAKISLVLICTLLTSVFMYEGFYKPRGAQATVLQGWTNIYGANAFPSAAIPYTVGAGTNRMLVIGVTSTVTTATATQTCTVTWGGKTLTAGPTDKTTSSMGHSYLFYLNEAGIASATGNSTVVTITGGTTNYNSVFAAVYSDVDQTLTPVGSTYNGGTAVNSAVGPLAASLTIASGDQAVEVLNIVRSGNSSARTVSTWATGWNSTPNLAVSNISSTATNGVAAYAATDVTAGTTTSQHTASSSALRSMTAMVLKGYFDLSSSTQIGSGVANTAATVKPGTADQKLGSFSFVTGKAAGDTVTGLTVTTAGTATIASVRIMNEAGSTQYFSTATTPTGNTWNFDTTGGGTAIPVTTTAANYKILVTYGSAIPAAASTATTANVTAYTCTLAKLGSDPVGATVTVLGTAAAAVANTPSGATIRWSYGTSGDSALVIRYAGTSSDTTMPTTYTSYLAGDAASFPGGTVIYAGTGTSVTDTVPAVGSYSYRVFEFNQFNIYAATALSLGPYNYAKITGVSPSQLAVGLAGQTVVINGDGFVAGTVSFGSGVTVTSSTWTTTQITAVVSTTSTGAKTATVTNTASPAATATGMFTVDAAPTMTTIAPATGPQDKASYDVTINGTGFLTGANATFSGTGITVNSTEFSSSTKLIAHVSIAADAARTLRNVTVTNIDGGTVSLPGAFSVLKPSYTIPGAISFPIVGTSSITVQVGFDADSDNDNSCVIKWGTDGVTFPNTATVTRKSSYYTATVTGLSGGAGGADGDGKLYYFQAQFADADNAGGIAPIVGLQSTKGSALTHNSLNLNSDKWPQGWGLAEGKYGAFTCSTCHNRAATNAKLVGSSITAPSMENWSSSGGTALAVSYSGALADDSAHATSSNVCEVCHSRTEHHRYNNAAANHQGNTDCTVCHSHKFGFALDSNGGQDCTICHSALNTGAYHHDLSAAASCLNCHVDHNVFRSDLNATNGKGRAANLRSDSTVATVASDSSTYANTDFIPAGTNGGLCVSCHQNAQTKTDSTQTATVSKDVFAVSAHNYTASSTYSRDGSTFQANCSKCHTDDAAKKAQADGNQFSTHGSSVADILAPLGDPSPTPGGICYRCHSKSSDAVDGTPKATAGKDYYGAGAMSADAEGIFGVFQKTGSVHNMINCTDCHNTHGAKGGAHAVGTNLAGPPLNGATGVKPIAFPSFWKLSSAGNVTAVNSIAAGTDLEAYVCLKCHSGAAGSLPTSPSGGFAMTDVLKEFNPNNKGAFSGTYVAKQTAGGFHPVFATTANNLGAIKLTNLVTTNFPWSTTTRNMMTCSDCHGSDSTTDPSGPHGSAAKFLLRGPNTLWNGTLKLSSSGMPAGTFCANCHSASFANSRFTSHTSNHSSAVCFDCHAAIPHGGPRPGMLVSPVGVNTANVPAQMADWDLNSTYATTGAKCYILSYPSTNTTNWSSSNCGCNGTGGM